MGDANDMRPLSGWELGEMHRTMVDAEVDREFRLAWLRRESDRWFNDAGRVVTEEAGDAE